MGRRTTLTRPEADITPSALQKLRSHTDETARLAAEAIWDVRRDVDEVFRERSMRHHDLAMNALLLFTFAALIAMVSFSIGAKT